MLARLREEKLVSTRRDGKTIFYSLADESTAEVIGMLYRLFCGPGEE
jgi:ArsR family transcriptional regulator